MFKHLMLIMTLMVMTEAGIGTDVDCYFDHNEPDQCTSDESGLCFWNYGLNYCDTRFNDLECSLAPNYDTCIVTIGCTWDSVNHWCDEMDEQDQSA
ncbi:MAG TPA: hypothetical protein VEK06_03370 [Myxococcota bacterium]|nr:hypothetical protein [Myxococcota bacterium]